MADPAFSGVRSAVAADVAAIAAVDEVASPGPFSISHIERYCGGECAARALVHEHAGEIDGFVLYTRVLDEGSIDNIAVAPGRRGQGLGGMLLAAALAALAEDGARRCLLEVRASNAPARALYARYEFSEDGVRPGYYVNADGREDAVLLSRRLQNCL